MIELTTLHPLKTKFVPYGELIQLDYTPPTFGGLVIPDNAKAKMMLEFEKIKVLACGAGCKQVKVGDFVLVPPKMILVVKIDGGQAYFFSESKILAVCEAE